MNMSQVSRPTTRAASSKNQPGPVSQTETDKAGGRSRSTSPHQPPISTVTIGDLQRDIAKVLEKLDGIGEEVRSINHRMQDIERSVEFNSSKISELERDIPKTRTELQQELKKMEEKIIYMEIYNRKSNLLFYGVEQSQGEVVVEKLRWVFGYLGVEKERAGKIMLANAHRLPSRNPPERAEGAGEKRNTQPAPIIAKFISMSDRDDVISCFETKQRQRARETPDPSAPALPRITVRTDLPPGMKEKRGVLAREAYKLRKEKHLATRIKVKGVKVVLEVKEKGSASWKEYRE